MLLYSLEQARHEKTILPKVLKLKLPIPKAMAEAPSLSLGLDLYWDAFMDLCTCRGGMGDGPIPWTAAMEWAAWMELDDETTHDLWYLITRMDETWLEHQSKKREEDRGRGKLASVRTKTQKGLGKDGAKAQS